MLLVLKYFALQSNSNQATFFSNYNEITIIFLCSEFGSRKPKSFTLDVSIEGNSEDDVFINDKFSIVSRHCELARS